MLEELFGRRTLNIENALAFGFIQGENGFIYETSIMNGSFLLEIVIPYQGDVQTKLTEKETGEEYTLYKTNAVGSFVGEIRETIGDILSVVAERCFDIFKSEQTKEIVSYVGEKYGDELEFLWEKSPGNAIFRRKDSAKWYGVILTIPRSKLGLGSEEMAEVINLHIKPEEMKALLEKENYFPGWHMNKKSWFTVILDGSVPTEEICRRIDESYILAKK